MFQEFVQVVNRARRAIGKPPVERYVIPCESGLIDRAFSSAIYLDARAAEMIYERDLALAEVRRQVAPVKK